MLDAVSARKITLSNGVVDPARIKRIDIAVSYASLVKVCESISEELELALEKFNGKIATVEAQLPRNIPASRKEYWDKIGLHLAVTDMHEPMMMGEISRILIFYGPEIGAAEAIERGETCANCRVSSERGGKLECKRYPEAIPTTKRNWCGEHRSF